MESVMFSPANEPEVEVSSKPTRRRFPAEYKRRILKEAAACTERGAIGALLRREGLYSSHLIAWQEAAKQGGLAALESKKRGPKAKAVNPLERELVKERREAAKWKKRAERAEVMLEIQKKFSQLMGIALPPPPPSDDEDA